MLEATTFEDVDLFGSADVGVVLDAAWFSNVDKPWADGTRWTDGTGWLQQLFGSAEALDDATTLEATKFVDAELFGSHEINVTLEATKFVDAELFGSHEIKPISPSVAAQPTIANTGGDKVGTLSFDHDQPTDANALILGLGSDEASITQADYGTTDMLPEEVKIVEDREPPPVQSAIIVLFDPASGVNTIATAVDDGAGTDDQRMEAFALPLSHAGPVRDTASVVDLGVSSVAIAVPASVGDEIVLHVKWRNSEFSVTEIDGADDWVDDEGVNAQSSRGAMAWALVDGDEAEWNGTAYTLTINFDGSNSTNEIAVTAVSISPE